MNIAKYQAAHSVVGNAPANAVMDGTATSGVPRFFYGTGAPNSTLLAGNARYNASQGGYVVNALVANGGSGNAVGDVITLTGGTFSQAVKITVDAVLSGVITDCHVSQVGIFTVYPTTAATQSSTTGSGTGATFTLNTPPPDIYIDLTTITAPVMWICTVAGSASGSTWQKVSGGGAGGYMQFKIVADIGDCWYCYTWDGTTLGTIGYNVIKPYKMRAGPNNIGSETIRGATYNYSYALVTSGVDPNNLYIVRSTTGAVTETCYPEPCPIITSTPANNEIIYGAPCTTNILASVCQSIIGVSVVNGGSGYSAGNTLTVAGGTLLAGYTFSSGATIHVDTVDGSGKILTCHISYSSNYSALPTMTANAATGGAGSSATFNLTACPQLLDTDNSREWAK